MCIILLSRGNLNFSLAPLSPSLLLISYNVHEAPSDHLSMQRRSIVTFVARRESPDERRRLITRDRPKARGPRSPPPPPPPRPPLLPPTISRHISLASKKLLHGIDPAAGGEAADPLGARIIAPIDYAPAPRFPVDSETTKTVASPRGPVRRNHHKRWGPDGTLLETRGRGGPRYTPDTHRHPLVRSWRESDVVLDTRLARQGVVGCSGP